MMITPEHFFEADIRVGRIIGVEDFPHARKPAYKLTIDFGDFGIKRSSAQITALYSKEALIGSLILAVVNFPPRQIADFQSEVLVLGIHNEKGEVILVRPEFEAPLGAALS
jgi:tRNA-binding protein